MWRLDLDKMKIRSRYCLAILIMSGLFFSLPAYAVDDWDAMVADILQETKATGTSSNFSFIPTFYSKFCFDTNNDSDLEDAIESRNRLDLEASYKQKDGFKAFMSAYIDYTALDSGISTRYIYDSELYEAYLFWRRGSWDLKIGEQVVTWGSADLLNPTDTMNPRDLREFVFTDFGKEKVPNFITELAWYGKSLSIKGYFIPFFKPMRFYSIGSDWALFPYGDIILDLFGDPTQARTLEELIRELDPDMAEQLNDLVCSMDVPDRTMESSSGGLRFTITQPGLTVNLDYLYTWDTIPVLRPGEEFKDILSDGVITKLELLGLFNNDLSFFSSYYHRMQMAGLDFSSTLGSFGLWGEAAYFDSQTHFTMEMESVLHPTYMAVFGLDRLFKHDIYFNVQYLRYQVLNNNSELTFLGECNDIIAFYFRKHSLSQKLTTELRCLSAVDGDRQYLIAPRIGYKFTDDLEATIGVQILGGDKQTVMGTFTENDHLFLLIKWII